MVTVQLSTNADKKTLILTMQGHAGAGERGNDLVCASVSCLAYTAAEAVGRMFKAQKLRRRPNIRLSEGDAVISCKPSEQFWEEAQLVMDVIIAGCEVIERAYPQNVHVIRTEH